MKAVRPYCWFAAVLLFLSYIIGLWFTLRTHAAVIWNTEVEEKNNQNQILLNGGIPHLNGLQHSASKPQRQGGNVTSTPQTSIRDSQMYKRILGQSLKHTGHGSFSTEGSRHPSNAANPSAGQPTQTPHLVPPKTHDGDSVIPENTSQANMHIPGLSEEENINLVRQVAEMAATAATVAARDATRTMRKPSTSGQTPVHRSVQTPVRTGTFDVDEMAVAEAAHASGGGHDAPNWSRLKSSVILLGATILYAIIAEILVNTVDVVLESVDIDEKFLGITLFALVPNTTEFLVCNKTLANKTPNTDARLECNILRNEWKYCLVDGDWIGLCVAGLPLADPSACALQRCAWSLHRSTQCFKLHFHVSWEAPQTLGCSDKPYSLIFPQWDMVNAQ